MSPVAPENALKVWYLTDDDAIREGYLLIRNDLKIKVTVDFYRVVLDMNMCNFMYTLYDLKENTIVRIWAGTWKSRVFLTEVEALTRCLA